MKNQKYQSKKLFSDLRKKMGYFSFRNGRECVALVRHSTKASTRCVIPMTLVTAAVMRITTATAALNTALARAVWTTVPIRC